jgi:hypothetical protein
MCELWYSSGGIGRATRIARAIATGGDRVRGQEWALSQTGNWGGFKLDSNGDGDYTDTSSPADLNQTRTHNAANEITAVAEDAGQPAWPDPVQDARGNMTSFPKPFDPANSFSAVYDAWNRMVEVESGQTTVGRYHFDGLNRRIRCDSDSQSRPGRSPDGRWAKECSTASTPAGRGISPGAAESGPAAW